MDDSGKKLLTKRFYLKENKSFNDGTIIDTGTLLEKLTNKPDKQGWFQVTTLEENKVKRVFYVKKEEIIFDSNEYVVLTKEEIKERKMLISDKWFNG